MTELLRRRCNARRNAEQKIAVASATLFWLLPMYARLDTPERHLGSVPIIELSIMHAAAFWRILITTSWRV